MADNRLSVSHSRAGSVSRASSVRSTRSRSQSLIDKNTAPRDLEPSDVLIQRFTAWKNIIKQLILYFQGLAAIENHNAKELQKLSAVIQVPFSKAGNQFLGEGGIQDVWYGIRDKTRVIADEHANLGRTVDSSIVQHLEKLRAEIKAHVRNIQNDTGKLATSVAKEREQSTRLVAELSTAISTFKATPMTISPKQDPYLANVLVSHQLHNQIHAENLLQKSIIIIQQNSANFEEGIVRSVQSAWQTYEEWQARSAASIQNIWVAMANNMASLTPDREWIAFSARSDHLLDPETPLRSTEALTYPNKDDPSAVAVHTGQLERKRRFTRTWAENYFVLSPAGYLHEFASSDINLPGGREPVFSLFLPSCTLGPPAPSSSKAHKFHIEGTTDGAGTLKSGSLREKFGVGGKQRAHAYSFRCRSRDEMMEWWNDIRMLCARYLVASEMIDRSGVVAAAVRGAGYAEAEEEYEDVYEDEGSSVEEEREDETLAHDQPQELLPSYTGSGAPVGYLADKKEKPSADPDNGLQRRPSQRQLDKSPEGGNGESKFKEAI